MLMTTALRISLPAAIRQAAIRPAMLMAPARRYSNIPRTPTEQTHTPDTYIPKWDQNEAVLLHETEDFAAEASSQKVFSTAGGHSSQDEVQEVVAYETNNFAPSMNIVFDE